MGFGACVGSLWDLYGICMGPYAPQCVCVGPLWDLHMVPMGFAWDWYWAHMVHVRDLSWTCMVLAWGPKGFDCGPCMGDCICPNLCSLWLNLLWLLFHSSL